MTDDHHGGLLDDIGQLTYPHQEKFSLQDLYPRDPRSPRCGTLLRSVRCHIGRFKWLVGAQMSKKTMSVHCPVCNVSSPRDLSELARPSGQSCLICGAFFSDYAWGELATALLAVQQLSDHFRTGVSHAR
jgi:hypothetical protein